MLTKNYLAIYAKSFSWAGFFLPKKTYNKCSALYDFCRVADNIADDEEKLEVKEIKDSTQIKRHDVVRFEPMRKREQAIVVQEVNHCRFRKGKKKFLTVRHDLANGFPSPFHSRLDEVVHREGRRNMWIFRLGVLEGGGDEGNVARD